MDNTLSGKPNIMTTTLRLLHIDNILYNYINTTRKEKGLWETVCSHRPPPFSTCFWGLKGGGVRTPCTPPPFATDVGSVSNEQPHPTFLLTDISAFSQVNVHFKSL